MAAASANLSVLRMRSGAAGVHIRSTPIFAIPAVLVLLFVRSERSHLTDCINEDFQIYSSPWVKYTFFGGVIMVLAIFYGIICFAGFYLIIKCFISRKRGIHLDGRLVGFQEERGTQYPVFSFTYEGEELTLPGGVPAEPKKFKYEEGESVKIIFDPSNRKFVDIEGSMTEYIYGIAAIVLGGFLLFYQLKKMGLF